MKVWSILFFFKSFKIWCLDPVKKSTRALSESSVLRLTAEDGLKRSDLH